MSTTIVRDEQPGDYEAITKVNDLAFGQPAEGKLVNALRENCDELISLVAERGGEVVGHIAFSPVTIDRDGAAQLIGMGLGPMSVLPEYQRHGIGSLLVQDGLEAVENEGWPFVVVLGHPEFYPRFGFERASKYGVRCPWEVPDEAFMIFVLDPAEPIEGGTAMYRPEFIAVI